MRKLYLKYWFAKSASTFDSILQEIESLFRDSLDLESYTYFHYISENSYRRYLNVEALLIFEEPFRGSISEYLKIKERFTMNIEESAENDFRAFERFYRIFERTNGKNIYVSPKLKKYWLFLSENKTTILEDSEIIKETELIIKWDLWVQSNFSGLVPIESNHKIYINFLINAILKNFFYLFESRVIIIKVFLKGYGFKDKESIERDFCFTVDLRIKSLNDDFIVGKIKSFITNPKNIKFVSNLFITILRPRTIEPLRDVQDIEKNMVVEEKKSIIKCFYKFETVRNRLHRFYFTNIFKIIMDRMEGRIFKVNISIKGYNYEIGLNTEKTLSLPDFIVKRKDIIKNKNSLTMRGLKNKLVLKLVEDFMYEYEETSQMDKLEITLEEILQ